MRWVKVLLVVAIIAALSAFAGFRYWQTRLEAPIAIEESTLYEVPRGASFDQVMANLEAQGIIAQAWPFRLLVRVFPDELPALRAGEFMLEPGMSGREVIALLGSDQVVSYPLTIPEGWTFEQMRELLAAAPKLEHRTAEMSDAEVMAALEHTGNSASLAVHAGFTFDQRGQDQCLVGGIDGQVVISLGPLGCQRLFHAPVGLA